MRTLLAPVFWLGRVLLWVVFLPLGLWRSVRHGRRKSEERTARLIAETLREDRERREDSTAGSRRVE